MLFPPAGGRYCYHPDYLGSVAMVTNSAGVVHQMFFTNPCSRRDLPFGSRRRSESLARPNPDSAAHREGEEMRTYENTSTGSFNSPYRFNGKEFDEQTGLAYYGARYYDNQMSMWLSVDPLAEKYPHSSPYVFSGNNPLYYIDPDGNELDVAQNKDSQSDVLSIVQKDNQQYVVFNADGSVDLNFGSLTKNEINKILKSDEGLNLLNDIVSAKESYLYESGDHSPQGIINYSNLPQPQGINNSYYVDGQGNSINCIQNWSITPHNIGSTLGSLGRGGGLRHPSYDGYVRISPGSWSRAYNENSPTPVPRASIVFHELAESYNRTTLKMPYTNASGTGAHESAIQREGNLFGPAYTPNTPHYYQR